MNKSTFFSGQPIFAQLLKLIPKDNLFRIVSESHADHYCKRFSTSASAGVSAASDPRH